MGSVASAADGLGREIVLGLLAEEPSGCYQLDRRLERRFRSADYAPGMADKTVKRLVREGLVRLIDAGQPPAAGTDGRRGKVYEPTPAGVQRFKAWMWSSMATPPVREELHAKIALCRPDDLPRMIELVRKAETVCVGKLQDLNREVQDRRDEVDPEQWSMRMDLVVSTGDQAWWESRISWLQQVHLYLEEEWHRYRLGLPARPASGRPT